MKTQTRMWVVLVLGVLGLSAGCHSAGGLFGGGCGCGSGTMVEADTRLSPYPCGDLWACYCPCNHPGCCDCRKGEGPDCCNPYYTGRNETALLAHPLLEPAPRAKAPRRDLAAPATERTPPVADAPPSALSPQPPPPPVENEVPQTPGVDSAPVPPPMENEPTAGNSIRGENTLRFRGNPRGVGAGGPNGQTNAYSTNDSREGFQINQGKLEGFGLSIETNDAHAGGPEGQVKNRPPRNLLPPLLDQDTVEREPNPGSSRRAWQPQGQQPAESENERTIEPVGGQSSNRPRKSSVIALRNYFRLLQSAQKTTGKNSGSDTIIE